MDEKISDDSFIKLINKYHPDFIFFGHTKNISLDLLENFRSMSKNLIISQWNEDPVMKNLEYSVNNIKNSSIFSSFIC